MSDMIPIGTVALGEHDQPVGQHTGEHGQQDDVDDRPPVEAHRGGGWPARSGNVVNVAIGSADAITAATLVSLRSRRLASR